MLETTIPQKINLQFIPIYEVGWGRVVKTLPESSEIKVVHDTIIGLASRWCQLAVAGISLC